MSEKTVLFVDDELPILKTIKRIFHKEPCQVLIAESGQQGLELLEQNTVHVVVSDQRMPQMSGAEFLHQVRLKHPHIIRLTMSGYADLPTVIECVNQAHIHYFLPKPWDSDELKSVVMGYLEAAEDLGDGAPTMEYCQTLRKIIAGQRAEIDQLKKNISA